MARGAGGSTATTGATSLEVALADDAGFSAESLRVPPQPLRKPSAKEAEMSSEAVVSRMFGDACTLKLIVFVCTLAEPGDCPQEPLWEQDLRTDGSTAFCAKKTKLDTLIPKPGKLKIKDRYQYYPHGDPLSAGPLQALCFQRF